MNDDAQNLEFQVEADATQAVRASNSAADSLASVVSKATELEAALRGIFTGVLPQGMAQLRQYADLMKQVSAMPDPRAFGRATRNLASGGPQTALQRATFQGVLADIKNDPALQRLQYEQQTNKVIEAREKVYQRIRTTLPDDATNMQRVNAYRKALSELGAMPAKASAEYATYRERTLTEVKAFEAQVREIKLTEAAKTAEAEAKIYDAAMRRSAANLSRIKDVGARNAQAQQVIGRLQSYGQRRGVDVDENRLHSVYSDEVDRRLATQVQMPAMSAEEMSVKANQRVRQAVADRKARFDVAGGSAMFGVEAHTMANYAIMGAGVGAAFGAGKQVLDLDNELKQLQATAGATNSEMGGLAKSILNVGASSNQSFKDIGEGATELVKAGYSIGQVADMIRPINNLAVATKTSFKDASDAVTIALQTFTLSAEKTKGVADGLAQLATKTKVPLTELSAALESVGEVAKGSDVQFEEVAAGFKIMADAGLKTSAQLGTGMKMLIEQLDAPTAKLQAQLGKVGLTAADVDVKTNGLSGALSNLSKAGFTSAEAMAGMNIRAAQAYIALSQNVAGFENLTTTITQNNTAANVALTAMGSLENQAKRLGNVVSDLAYNSFDPVLHTLAGIASALSMVLTGVSRLTPVVALLGTLLASFTTVKIVEWLGGMAVGALTAGTALEGLTIKEQASAVAAQLASMSFEEMAAAAAASSIAFLANPITAVTLGLTALIGVLSAYSWSQDQANQKAQEYAAKAQQAAEETKKYGDRIHEIDNYVDMLIERHARLATNTQEAGAAAQIATQKFGDWGLQIDKNISQVDTLIERLGVLRQQQAAAALESAKQQRDSLEGQNRTLNGQYHSGLMGAQVRATDFFGSMSPAQRQELARAGLLPLLQRIQLGQVNPSEIQGDLATLRTKGSGLSPGLQALVKSVTGELGNAAAPASQIASNNEAINQS
ncbi:MAG: phage tail tape measure protein, partial [Caulobacteraceae bacterium]